MARYTLLDSQGNGMVCNVHNMNNMDNVRVPLSNCAADWVLVFIFITRVGIWNSCLLFLKLLSRARVRRAGGFEVVFWF